MTVAENVANGPLDAEPVRRGVVRIYFDSTEVRHPNVLTGKLGRIGNRTLQAAARKAGAQLCVVDLVIEEIVHGRLRHLRREHGKLLKLAKKTRDYVSATIEDLPSDEELLTKFRGEVIKQLTDLQVEIVLSDAVAVADVLKLSLRRTRPFVGKDEDEGDPTGFHDAVILLASFRDAQQVKADLCFFVSQDGDHSAEAIEQLAKDHGVTCQLFRPNEELTETLETIAEATAIQRAEVALEKATAYMRKHAAAIQARLDEMKPIHVGDLIGRVAGKILQITTVAVAPGSVRALPRGVRSGGMVAAPLAFWVDVAVTAVVAELVVVSPSVAGEEEPFRPGREIADAGIYGRVREVEGEKEIVVPMKGTAVAPQFDGTSYLGEPAIESLGVYAPLSEALGASLTP